MKYLAAYLLAQLGGHASPSVKDISAILSSVGIETDAAQLTKVVADLQGKDVAELIKAGTAKLASMPSSGGSAAAASGAVTSAPSKAAPVAAQVEEKEESDEEMGFGLFD